MIDYDSRFEEGWEPDPSEFNQEYLDYLEWMDLHSRCRRARCLHGNGKNCAAYMELECPRGHGMQQVMADGPVIEQHRDPTQSYRLHCGDYTI